MTEIDKVWSDLSNVEKIIWGAIATILSIVTVTGALMSGFELTVGNLRIAEVYASIASGVATVMLVGVTVWYSYETRRMVRETRQSREEERARVEKERKQELSNLRRALREEISSIDPKFLIEREATTIENLTQLAPRSIFDQNADEVGRLTQEELKPIIRYYDSLYKINQYAEMESEREEAEVAKRVFDKMHDLSDAREEALTALNKNIEEYEEDA